MNETIYSITKSWCEKKQSIHTTKEILAWIRELNDSVQVEIKKTDLENCGDWFYDEKKGCIRNAGNSFFAISGFRKSFSSRFVCEQPILIQPEIGYLGIICKEFNGVMHFLMQAKIEPGNVNKIQLSPTIQATKSNFTQKHGGKKTNYLDYFLNASKYEIVVDQIQSEQSSRFLKKRNRNIIIRVQDDIEVLPSHRWMTLGQLKELMKHDNLVNMDTRTVLSCIPFCKMKFEGEAEDSIFKGFTGKGLFRSVFCETEVNLLPTVYQYINNAKMFDESKSDVVPLAELESWFFSDGEFICNNPYSFKVVFCDISIEGREVRHWAQPLFEAMGIATFGLIMCEEKGLLKFLVHAKSEIGCFDVLELGPSVQREAISIEPENEIDVFFMEKLKNNEGIAFDHLLSEEGGRFYHEQNRNVLMRVSRAELPPLPPGYFLVDFRTLNELAQINNILNIQLRNLLSLLEA